MMKSVANFSFVLTVYFVLIIFYISEGFAMYYDRNSMIHHPSATKICVYVHKQLCECERKTERTSEKEIKRERDD